MMMIARGRRRGIASLNFAPRTDRWRTVRPPDPSCFTTIESFSSDIACLMHAFAPVRCVSLGIPNNRTIGRV
jgi:hypothetical protein